MRPDDIRSKAFPVRRQGYDPGLVDAFLQEIAVDLEALAEVTAAESVYLHYGGELKSLLQIATEKAERVQAEAEAEIRHRRADAEAEIQQVREAAERNRVEAETISQQARAEANKIVEVTRKQAEQQRVAAQREAQELVTQARAEADQMVTEAQQRVDQLRDMERAVIDCLRKANGFVGQAMSWLGAGEDPGSSNGHERTAADSTVAADAGPRPTKTGLGPADESPNWWSRPRTEAEPSGLHSNGRPGNGRT